MQESLLEEIGLTKGEIKVYLTLLKLGETTTGKIIEDAQISSGKIYEILDKLIKKGLVGFIIKEKTKHFTAASPQSILEYVQRKENELQHKKLEIEKALPSLLAIGKSAKNEYETHLYLGFKGFETAIFDALHEVTGNDTVLAVGVTGKKSKTFNLLWQRWHKERVRRKIKCRILVTELESGYHRVFQKMKYTELKHLKGITPAAMDVVGDKVLILTHGEDPSCLVIKHRDIRQSIVTFFQTMWNHAK